MAKAPKEVIASIDISSGCQGQASLKVLPYILRVVDGGPYEEVWKACVYVSSHLKLSQIPSYAKIGNKGTGTYGEGSLVPFACGKGDSQYQKCN